MWGRGVWAKIKVVMRICCGLVVFVRGQKVAAGMAEGYQGGLFCWRRKSLTNSCLLDLVIQFTLHWTYHNY